MKKDRGQIQTHSPKTTTEPRGQVQRRHAIKHYTLHCNPDSTTSYLGPDREHCKDSKGSVGYNVATKSLRVDILLLQRENMTAQLMGCPEDPSCWQGCPFTTPLCHTQMMAAHLHHIHPGAPAHLRHQAEWLIRCQKCYGGVSNPAPPSPFYSSHTHAWMTHQPVSCARCAHQPAKCVYGEVVETNMYG